MKLNKKNITYFNIAFFILVFFFVIFFFYRFSQQNNLRIQEQNLVYAEDAAKQTAMRLNETLKNNQLLIERYANFISNFMNIQNLNEKVLKDLEKNSPFSSIRFANKAGESFSSSGKTREVTSLPFFTEGLQGKSGVAAVINSEIYPENMLGFYAPIRQGNEVAGVLRGNFLAETSLRQWLQSSYFGQAADLFLCLPNGNIIANSVKNEYSGNIFTVLGKDFLVEPEILQKVKAVFQSGDNGAVMDARGPVTANISIMNLPSYPYILVQSFPERVTQRMVNHANRSGMELELCLLVLSACVAVWLLARAHMQKRSLELENRLYSTVMQGMSSIFNSQYYIAHIANGLYTPISAYNLKNYTEISETRKYKDLLVETTASMVSDEERREFLRFFAPENLAAVLARTPIAIFECHLKENGRDIWENRIACCIKKDETGKPAEALLLRQDVTEMKERELDAKKRLLIADRNEKQYRKAATANAMCSYEFNISKNLITSDISANLKGRKISLLGFKGLSAPCKASEFFKSWEDAMYPETLPDFVKVTDLDYLKKCFEAGKTEVELDLWCVAEGQDLCLRQSFYLTREEKEDGESGDLIAMCILRDITEQATSQRKQTQALQEALAQARHANEAKTTFLSNMSHDIRTPMNAIIGFATIASTHMENQEQVRECLQKVLSSSNHLLCLINDILDMSRIESGKMQLNIRECNIPELMHNIVNIIQPQVKAKKLNFFIDTDNVTNEDIYSDPLKLNQIFINLLGNAVKYTPAGGTIHFGISQENIYKHGYAKYIFTVRDNGIGMSQEFVKHIFEPFERESTTTISGIQGTGLGMAITKNIVEMLNGEIEVESETGVGSTFRVALTFQLQEEETDKLEIPQLINMRAIVVDDDPHVCNTVSRMLHHLGMRVECTTSGKKAMELTKKALEENDPYQTFIIDWQMPEMNGVDLARNLRDLVGNEVPIIVVTAYEWTDIEIEAREAGISAFCAKPLFMSDLKNALLANHKLKEEPEAPKADRAMFTGKRVLLVDDLEMNREVAQFILEDSGFVVEMAPDGTDAVEKVKNSPEHYYDVILMDVQMPTMNGYEATRIIRNLNREDVKTLPIIAMTANALEDDREAALKSGMNSHISKPIDIDKFFEVLLNFVSHDKA